MKYAPSPSVPPRSVRVAMSVMAMRTKPLPEQDPEEERRAVELFMRRPLPRRAWR